MCHPTKNRNRSNCKKNQNIDFPELKSDSKVCESTCQKLTGAWSKPFTIKKIDVVDKNNNEELVIISNNSHENNTKENLEKKLEEKSSDNDEWTACD